MEQSITAIYEDGKLIPLDGALPKSKSKIKVTILEELGREGTGLTVVHLKQLQSKIKNLPANGTQYQRKLRDEW